jgi:hypothetical protein
MIISVKMANKINKIPAPSFFLFKNTIPLYKLVKA